MKTLRNLILLPTPPISKLLSAATAVRTLILVLSLTITAFGQPEKASAKALTKADSLFSARQYTQAFELYDAIRGQGYWSPAMLLKMAYIQEALGHVGESMYYLNLYTLASHDPQAAKKMEELAEKNSLEGYEDDTLTRLAAPLREYYLPVAGALGALNLLLLALIIDRYRRKKTTPVLLPATLILLLVALFAHVHYSLATDHAIVTRSNTYLMSGPSGGASVVEIIGEGHQLQIKGRKDVWLKVEWKEKEVYVRDFLVRPVQL